MLWMITDFNKIKDLEMNFHHLSNLFSSGLRRVLFRNRDQLFSERNSFSLISELKRSFPELECYVHENIGLMEMTGADGIHLSSIMLPLLRGLRSDYPEKKISVSVHNLNNMQRAIEEGADFLFYSPVYTPFSKAEDKRPIVDPVNHKQVYLLGGITRSRAENLIKKGFVNLSGISLFYEGSACDDVAFLISKINEVSNAEINPD